MHGQWRDHEWELSSQEYSYDKVGRLTEVVDEVAAPVAGLGQGQVEVMKSGKAKHKSTLGGPPSVNVHPSYGVRGGGTEGTELPAVGLTRWIEMSDDERCTSELLFAAAIIRWLITVRSRSILTFYVDMTDVSEREGLLASAREAGVEVHRDAAGTLSGRLVTEIADAVVTCTQSVLTVRDASHVICEVVDYLDQMRLYMSLGEVTSLGDALRSTGEF